MSKQNNVQVSKYAREIQAQTGMKYTEALREAEFNSHIQPGKEYSEGGRLNKDAQVLLPLISQLNPINVAGETVQWMLNGGVGAEPQCIDRIPRGQFEDGWSGPTGPDGDSWIGGTLGLCLIDFVENKEDFVDDHAYHNLTADEAAMKFDDAVSNGKYFELGLSGKLEKVEDRLYKHTKHDWFISAFEGTSETRKFTIGEATHAEFDTINSETRYTVDLIGIKRGSDKIKLIADYVNKYVK